MLAWRVHENGEPRAAMRLDEVPDPRPGAGELLLKVRAANVNFPDALLCRGHYQVRPPLPFTPGVEFCGEVVAVGEGVTGHASGDRVVAPAALPGGAFAELAVVPAARVLPAPPGLDDAEAAALHIGYQTGWFGLHRRAGLREGETLLVHAAAGGVGSAAVQLGKAAGAQVIGVVGGPEKARTARELGADVVVDRTCEDFVAVVKEATGGRGADVVYDPVGGDAYTRSTKCVAFEGRILVVGFAGGTHSRPRPQPRSRQELLRRRPALGPVQHPRPRGRAALSRGAHPPGRAGRDQTPRERARALGGRGRRRPAGRRRHDDRPPGGRPPLTARGAEPERNRGPRRGGSGGEASRHAAPRAATHASVRPAAPALSHTRRERAGPRPGAHRGARRGPRRSGIVTPWNQSCAAYRLSSRRARDRLWTSSGPSASRSVRAAAYSSASGKSWLTPPAPCNWMARSRISPTFSRGGDLDGLDLGVRAPVADGVHQPCGLEHQQPQLLDLHPRLGDPLAGPRPARPAACRRRPVPWRAGTSARSPARPCRSAACSGGSGPGRAAPGRWRSRRPPRRSDCVTGTRTSSKTTSAWPPWSSSS